MRRFVVGLAVVCSACAALGSSTTATTTPPTAPLPEPTTTTTAIPTTTTTVAMDPLMDEIGILIELTEELRGLYFLAPPVITVVTAAELSDRIREDIAEELDPAELARDEEVLRILGVLDGDLALGVFYTELLAEQVVGFYDAETKEMVIAASAGGLTEYDKLVIVHELTHALTDQHFDFGPLSEELIEAEEYDAHAALSALIEGDATYVEGLYVQGLGPGALLEILAEFDDFDSPIFDAAPYYLQESLVAPYLDGLEFVTSQFATGAWSAIDLAYRIVPTTTEQVLHPEAYLRGEAQVGVEISGVVPVGYEVGEESTWGESGLRALLGSVLLPGPLASAVEGWGGDRYRVLWDGERAIFQMHYVGDTPADADELAAGLAEYLEARVPADARWWLLRFGDVVAVVVASDDLAGWDLTKTLQAEGFR